MVLGLLPYPASDIEFTLTLRTGQIYFGNSRSGLLSTGNRRAVVQRVLVRPIAAPAHMRSIELYGSKVIPMVRDILG